MAEANTERMEAITKGLATKSDKIRALTAAGGYSRRQIADFLKTIPQHVRNVQVQNERKTEAPPQSTHIELGAGGRIVIPAAIREAMGLKEGDRLVVRFEDGELRLMTKQLALERMRELVRKHVPPGVSLVDELIADRRREAAQEEAEIRKAISKGKQK